MRKVILLVVVLILLCSSTALALAPMGPPMAGLEKGQFSAGVDYSYSSMNLKLYNGKWNDSDVSSFTVKYVKMNTVLAKLGYGITDNWEAYLDLGGANVNHEDAGFAIGFGTKATL